MSVGVSGLEGGSGMLIRVGWVFILKVVVVCVMLLLFVVYSCKLKGLLCMETYGVVSRKMRLSSRAASC